MLLPSPVTDLEKKEKGSQVSLESYIESFMGLCSYESLKTYWPNEDRS